MLLVPTGKAAVELHGVIRLNETAAFLINCLQEDVERGQLVDALISEYDVERTTAENHVNALLDKLRELGAVAE